MGEDMVLGELIPPAMIAAGFALLAFAGRTLREHHRTRRIHR
ncbi:hypothetical protein [Agromyces archimandritae]|nr:hypothetical protein [Agromyces archimandritae]